MQLLVFPKIICINKSSGPLIPVTSTKLSSSSKCFYQFIGYKILKHIQLCLQLLSWQAICKPAHFLAVTWPILMRRDVSLINITWRWCLFVT
jgi:hypothetical protein